MDFELDDILVLLWGRDMEKSSDSKFWHYRRIDSRIQDLIYYRVELASELDNFRGRYYFSRSWLLVL